MTLLQEIIDTAINEAPQLADAVICTDLKALLYSVEHDAEEDFIGMDPEELKEAAIVLMQWYGIAGKDFD